MKNVILKKLVTVVATINFIVFSHVSYAGVIANGDFTNGLDNWSDASFTGQVVSNNGIANLSTGTGTGLYSAVLVQGDDGFFNFNSPILIDAQNSWISFDLWQSSKDVDASESGISSLNDALSLSVYDAFDFSFDVLFSDLLVTSQQQNFLLDVSSLIGRSVAFSFELNDENDGFDTMFSLDNVQLTSSVSVPEPSTLLIFLLAMYALTRKQLIKR